MSIREQLQNPLTNVAKKAQCKVGRDILARSTLYITLIEGTITGNEEVPYHDNGKHFMSTQSIRPL